MTYKQGDIQFSDDAKGAGRALRVRSDTNYVILGQDSDNPDITIITFREGGEMPVSRVTKSTSFTVEAPGEIRAQLYVISATANMVITMPPTSGNNKQYNFLRIDATGFTVDIQGYTGIEQIDGSGSYSLLSNDAPSFITPDYADWYKV